MKYLVRMRGGGEGMDALEAVVTEEEKERKLALWSKPLVLNGRTDYNGICMKIPLY
jgi:hypothetical protein